MNIILFLHSILRWVVLLSGLWALINGLTGTFGKRSYTSGDDKSGLFFLISCDIQLILGLILYFSNGWFAKLKGDITTAMQNPLVRFFTIEHLLMMLLAILLVHIGRSSVKKSDSATKHKKMLIYFGLAILIILASIPWPFRTEIARPLMQSL